MVAPLNHQRQKRGSSSPCRYILPLIETKGVYMNQRQVKLFQFIAVNDHVTNKCVNALWCCKDHALNVNSLLIEMSNTVIEIVKKHKDNFDALPPDFEEVVDEFLLVLNGIDKTVDKMHAGVLNVGATMPHGGTA